MSLDNLERYRRVMTRLPSAGVVGDVPEIEFIQDSFLEVDWSDADVVFANSHLLQRKHHGAHC